MYTLEEIQQDLKDLLDSERYEHTLGVSYTAACMAAAAGEEIDRYRLAGMLHDCAKYGGASRQLQECQRLELPLSDVEIANPGLVHGKLGASYARSKYGVEDEEILSAITYHTTGKEGMSHLEKVVFTADYIEPNRDEAPRLTQLRREAFTDLDLCVLHILEDTLEHLRNVGRTIDPGTEQVYSYYKKLILERKEIPWN